MKKLLMILLSICMILPANTIVLADESVEEDIFCEVVGEDAAPIKSDSRMLNYFSVDGVWADSWSDVEEYFENCVDKKKEYMCAWIYSQDDSKRMEIYSNIAFLMSEKIGKFPKIISAWGGCPFTSPHPNAQCIQIYTDDWFEENVPKVATNFKISEVADGVQASWDLQEGITEQIIEVSCEYMPNYYEMRTGNIELGKNSCVDTNTGKGRTYYYSVTLANKYGYSKNASQSITCTHDGKKFTCKHKFSDAPEFKWSSDGASCTVSAVCKVCQKTIKEKATIFVKESQKADFANDGYAVYRAVSSITYGKYYEEEKRYDYAKLDKATVNNITFKGTECKPKVTVLDAKGKVVSSKFYTVSYSNNTAPGNGVATIAFAPTVGVNNPYRDVVTRSFKIKLASPTISKKEAKSKAVRISYGKVSGADYYEIDYSTSKDFKKKSTKKTQKNAATISKLKANKKYYIRVRAVNGDVKSKYSNACAIKTKK